jgi:DNA-binding MarR family transcriptional regulator
MSALADYLGLERSTLSGLVDRAEGRGLLKREHDPDDGRVVTVALASEGAALASRAAGQVRQGLSTMTSRLSSAERHELCRLLEKLLAEAGGHE